MASPTPSLDSLPRANSIGSFGDHPDYLSLSPLEDSPLTVSGSSPPASDSVKSDSDPTEIPCLQCKDTVRNPKLLACFHTYCDNCLEKNKLSCPRCQTDSIEGLLNNILCIPAEQVGDVYQHSVRCTGKSQHFKILFLQLSL